MVPSWVWGLAVTPERSGMGGGRARPGRGQPGPGSSRLGSPQLLLTVNKAGPRRALMALEAVTAQHRQPGERAPGPHAVGQSGSRGLGREAWAGKGGGCPRPAAERPAASADSSGRRPATNSVLADAWGTRGAPACWGCTGASAPGDRSAAPALQVGTRRRGPLAGPARGERWWPETWGAATAQSGWRGLVPKSRPLWGSAPRGLSQSGGTRAAEGLTQPGALSTRPLRIPTPLAPHGGHGPGGCPSGRPLGRAGGQR